ncbi:DUF2007 domain-containing protein [Endozoicomonas sp. G2_1]|uniref:putative signal transducing protein n=1 Tax=Endozoicomonas sp. G2_1 TaxID=2821091 RepID=UPI001ADB2945|nr:DUF2007 domain-containing protein [Endozoicomonas sp. G2_1]MBO9491561.1 DUF2007 domain-containing protein [Endozoicomonas sp. G2_1]
MKLVYKSEQRFSVNHLELQLNQLGIKTLIKNEFAGGAAGELSPIDVWPELWILEDTHEQLALKIVAEHEQNQQKGNDIDWFCRSCGEANGAQFELCWQCQTVRN